MIKINEFIKNYFEQYQIGFTDDIITEYIKIKGIDNSEYDFIKSEVEDILKTNPNIIFSEITGKFFFKGSNLNNSTISKLKNLQSFLSGRIISEIDQIILSKISGEDIEASFSEFEIINLTLLKRHLLINSEFENVYITIDINQKSFNIRTEYKKDLDEHFAYLTFLNGKDDYTFNKKSYLPLDSILYLSLLKINNLLHSKFNDFSLKIDIFEHIQ